MEDGFTGVSQTVVNGTTINLPCYSNCSFEVPCVVGSYCVGGVSHFCPAGRYGCSTHMGSANCSGACPLPVQK